MSKKIKLCYLMALFTAICLICVGMNSAGADVDTDMSITAAKPIEINISSEFREASVCVDNAVLYCGPSCEYDLVAPLNKSQSLKVLGKINDDWYIAFDCVNNLAGCINRSCISFLTGSSSKIDIQPNEDDMASGDIIIPDDSQRLLYLENELRKTSSVDELIYDQELSSLAYEKARDMVENNYFSHQSVSYGSPFEMMRSSGISFTAAAENIAGNQTSDGAFYAWIASDTHKDNIINNAYTKTGIGVYTSPVYGKIIVQLFTN